MRIIGGQWRGRKLTAVGKGDAAAHLRPTSDRVRESLFNLLQNGGYGNPCAGARVLDVFAGTGALGLEALSRGADEAVFIENGRKSMTILRENIALLQANGTVVARDAARPGGCAGAPFDLVFMDPPYGKAMGERALASLRDWVAQDALIIWEESTPPSLPDWLNLSDQRRYGDTLITIARAMGASPK